MTKLAIDGGPRAVPEGMMHYWPVITEEDKQAVRQALDDAMETLKFTTNHPATKGLEADIAAYVGAKHCLTANSGTAALHMAVVAAGVEPGDEVITSAYTFLASASCVLHHNAIPIFADIQPDTYNIDPASIEAHITERTRAIIPVHIFGLPADMDEIMAIARTHNLVVIEDACQAFGTEYKGRKAGTLGHIGCYSMESSKLLPSCSEGGLLVTDSDEHATRAALVRMFGEGEVPAGQPREYNAMTMGWNYRISFMAAAMGRSQLGRFDAWQAHRLANCAALSERLAGIPGVEPPVVPEDRTHGFFIYPFTLQPEALGLDVDVAAFTDAVSHALKAEGMPAARWQGHPVPGQSLFQSRIGYGKGCPWSCPHAREGIDYSEQYPVTEDLIARTLTLKKSTGQTYPNPPELMDRFGDAVEKVMVDNLDAIVAKAKTVAES